MSCAVENPLFQGNHIIIGEQQEQILEGRAQKERPLDVIRFRGTVIDVHDTSISIGRPAVFLYCQQKLKAPKAILFIMGQSPEYKITFVIYKTFLYMSALKEKL